MTTITSPLSDDDRKVVGEARHWCVVDLIDLSLIGKQEHWHLTGRSFRSVHRQLDEVAEVARTHVDVLAERCIAIGVNPDGRAATVARGSGLPSVHGGCTTDDETVKTTAEVLEAISLCFRERVEGTEEPDPVTQDLIIAAFEDVERQWWMWQAMI